MAQAMKRPRSTSAAQLLLFSAPATTAGLGRTEAAAALTALLKRKFGPGWEHRSDAENAIAFERLERRRRSVPE
jgi:hypothetical protein